MFELKVFIVAKKQCRRTNEKKKCKVTTKTGERNQMIWFQYHSG